MVKPEELPAARAAKDQVKARLRDKGVDVSVGIGEDGTPAVRPGSPEAARRAAEALGEVGLKAEFVDPGDGKAQ